MTHRIFQTSFASVYVHYLAKAANNRGRTKDEVDEIIRWMTGYSQIQLAAHLIEHTTFEVFFAQAPCLNPARHTITGLICGIRIESMEPGLMQEIRYMDKLIDELAKGKAMEKILRA